MIDLLHCTLEPLREDGELMLYRARHASLADGVAPSVLVVGPAGEYVSPATLARLEHEYALAILGSGLVRLVQRVVGEQ